MGQVILDVEAIRGTDSEDGSGWTYGDFLCTYHDRNPYSFDCVTAYSRALDLIGHMQEDHRDVDLDTDIEAEERDHCRTHHVDLDTGTVQDVDLDG